MIREKCLEIGTISKTHGYDGSVRIDLKGIESIALSKKEPLFLRIAQKLVPFFMEEFRKANDSVIARFEDINDNDQARRLCGYKVYAREAAVQKEEAGDLESLIGYQVSDVNLGKLGEISNYIESETQPLLVMDYKDMEVLIPYVEEIILEIDDENKHIEVDLPEGLIELYSNDPEK